MTIPPSTKIVLVKIAKKNGKFPIKLRVTFDRVQKFYLCNIDMIEEEFNRIFHSDRLTRKEKIVKDTITGIEAKALEIIRGMPHFDFETFESKLYNRSSGNGDVYDLFVRIYNELMNLERIGSAIMYNTVLNSLKSYKSKLTFEQITPAFLSQYETWLLTNTRLDGKSNAKTTTTVGIYMRHLRSVFNKGILEKLVSKELYPFGRNKYIVPVGNNIKKALTLEEVGKIYNYETSDTGWERKAKDFWCFSYLCNGMNIADIATLKYKDISGSEIHYERAKTKRSNRGKGNSLIAIAVLPQAQKIIDTWGNLRLSAETYIFPILNEGDSAIDIKKKVQQFTKNINKYVKRIALTLNIEKNVTTYVARHSFATVLKRSGSTIEAISENLGHKNIMTTRSYLGSFESESRKKAAQALVAFDVPE